MKEHADGKNDGRELTEILKENPYTSEQIYEATCHDYKPKYRAREENQIPVLQMDKMIEMTAPTRRLGSTPSVTFARRISLGNTICLTNPAFEETADVPRAIASCIANPGVFPTST